MITSAYYNTLVFAGCIMFDSVLADPPAIFNNKNQSINPILPDTKDIFKITNATWITLGSSKAICLSFINKRHQTGEVKISYRDGRNNFLPGYMTLKALMVTLKLTTLSVLCVDDNVTLICPELTSKYVGFYLQGDNYFSPKSNKLYEQLAILMVFDYKTGNFHDDIWLGYNTLPARHEFYEKIMKLRTLENKEIVESDMALYEKNYKNTPSL